MNLGLLHPGEMGSAVGAAARAGSAAEVRWDPAGRGPATVRRAESDGLRPAASLAELCAESDLVLSVCPPHAALDVARAVAGHGFSGLYADANAIAPGTAARVADIDTAAGASYVDGGIVGGPPRESGTTRLYLSGPRAAEVAAVFAGSPLGTVVLDGALTAASALKATYAAWTKGSSALLIAVREAARRAGVEDALLAEWERSQPALLDRHAGAERSAASKGWRWVAEMREIAATFEQNGQPAGFHDAAAAIYQRYPRPE